jgi:two-component system chemotaxis response regulator CheY
MSDTKAPTILVADDVEVCRAFVSQTLMNAGYNVVEASDGVEAIAALKNSGEVGMLVLDVEMPNLDGLACLKALRADPTYASLPVILLTAKPDRNFILEARTLKVSQYLLKSEFRAADLLARVSKCLTGDTPMKKSA